MLPFMSSGQKFVVERAALSHIYQFSNVDAFLRRQNTPPGSSRVFKMVIKLSTDIVYNLKESLRSLLADPFPSEPWNLSEKVRAAGSRSIRLLGIKHQKRAFRTVFSAVHMKNTSV